MPWSALLVIDPWLSRSFGFALSTLATFGLLLFAGTWGRRFARCLPDRLHWLGAAIAIPVAAQAMCGPVVVLLQGSVSVVGVLANLLAAPLVAPATVLGVTVALLAVVAAPVAAAVAWAAMLPTTGIAWVARSCADVPMGSLPWPDGPPGAFLLAGLSLVLLFCGPWLVALLRRRPGSVAALAAVSLAAAWPTGSVGWPPPGWRLVACDVGQGDGLALATARATPSSSTRGPTRRRSTPACAGCGSARWTPSCSRTSTPTTSTGARGAPRPGRPADPHQPGARPRLPGA